jgi:outer membrane murein-binding lipoprotein Lpp
MKLITSSSLVAGLALTALFLAGCGGSGGGTTMATATDKSKVAQLLKDVFAGRNLIQAAPAAPGRSKTDKSKTDKSKTSPPLMTRLEEGDLQVGQVVKFADDLWGRIEAVSYDTFQGYRSVTKLDYKYFKDEQLTQYIGFDNYVFSVAEDGTGYTFSETELNQPTGPPYYKKEEIWGRLGEYYKNDFVEVTDLSGNGGPDRVRIEGGSEWLGGDSSTFYVRYPIRGELFNASGKSFANGGLEVAWTTASGFRVEIQYDRDWNAVFSINGENPLLPASGQFDIEGKGTITFNDGTQANFDYYNNDFFVAR